MLLLLLLTTFFKHIKKENKIERTINSTNISRHHPEHVIAVGSPPWRFLADSSSDSRFTDIEKLLHHERRQYGIVSRHVSPTDVSRVGGGHPSEASARDATTTPPGGCRLVSVGALRTRPGAARSRGGRARSSSSAPRGGPRVPGSAIRAGWPRAGGPRVGAASAGGTAGRTPGSRSCGGGDAPPRPTTQRSGPAGRTQARARRGQ